MDFLKFLKDYEHEDVAVVKGIVESNKAKERVIIKEAFNSDYPSKKEALFNLRNYFIETTSAPNTIDVSYVNEHLVDLETKITQLSEGDIRIIIHNHEDSKGGGGDVGFEEETKPKKKRGRPRKDDFTKAPQNTGVIYDIGEEEEVPNEPSAEPDALVMDNNETPIDDAEIDQEENAREEVPKDDIVVADVIGDEGIFDEIFDGADEVDEDHDFGVKGQPSKLRWSDIVSKVGEQNDEREELVGELSTMTLNDEELKLATEMAETGEIVEDGGRISEAAGIISKINKL